MTDSFKNPSQETIDDYLRQAKTIAVVGLSSRQETAAYRVSAYLQEQGYRIIPVNPRAAGGTILGETVYASLADVPVHIDIVDVFRRSEFLADVAREMVVTDADVFWAQLGLESQEAEEVLRMANRNKIVMNKCTKIEHANMLHA